MNINTSLTAFDPWLGMGMLGDNNNNTKIYNAHM